jgi:signal transduction histidine kinase
MLYTVVFAACGAILVAITYGLLAANLREPTPAKPTTSTEDSGAGIVKPAPGVSFPWESVGACLKRSEQPGADPALRTKCKLAYQEGLFDGARSQREATLGTLLRYSLATLAAATLLAAVAGWVVAGRVLRPVHRITAAARNASQDRLTARVAMTGPRDELRELADTFDAMLDRLQVAFDDQGRFIANAGHELRTPLTVMRTTVDVVLAKPHPTHDDLLGMGRDVRSAIDHAHGLIEALLTLARADRGRLGREAIDLATVAEDALDAAAPEFGAAQLHTSLAAAPTNGDPILLERLAANLVDNAVRYNRPDGAVWVSTETVAGRVRLIVDNTGPLISPDDIGRLFEPFRRLRDRTGDGGFGLGLAVVASIAAAHGGAAAAEARRDGGLSVTVSLPIRS